MANSIIQKDKECYICGKVSPLHLHHIYGGAGRRKTSDANGFVVYLCPHHHNMSNDGVHFNKDLDDYFKEKCQRTFEEKLVDFGMTKRQAREQFMELIGENYIYERSKNAGNTEITIF